MVPVFIEALFLAGHTHVILDATSVTEELRKRWVSQKWKTRWKNFDTSREECIRRAELTNDNVIIPVIERMAKEIVFPTTDLWDLDQNRTRRNERWEL
jgi:predicted kinase